ncbi:MAG: bifunctional phosphopantothenoylcysteine decarboxylase/phosphopantothenate--cysteine ligase CoaBC [Bacteroidota bacterium]
MLKEKNILVGITGGIAAYKIPFLVRQLKKAGANVQVVMTESAQKFVTKLTLATLSGNEVISDMFFDHDTRTVKTGTWHIELGQWANAMIIAPATANTMAKLASGYSDNAVTTIALALRCPLLISPAMDADMWEHTTTQTNVTRLREIGYFVVPPESGDLASGLTGKGRLPDFNAIIEAVEKIIEKSDRDLEGKKILVTAGPTYEAIDPVRYIGNRSSGKMGYAIAGAAALRGADVTLISGPVSLLAPRNVRRITIESAREMHAAVTKEISGADALVMAAAVADYAPKEVKKNKIKKSDGMRALELKTTPDILSSLTGHTKGKVIVGFSLETERELKNAKQKLKQKKLDFIVLNNPLHEGAGFGSDTNIVTIIMKSGKVIKLKKLPKFDVANEILDSVVKLMKK